MEGETSQRPGVRPTHHVKCWMPDCGSENPVHCTGTEELARKDFQFRSRNFDVDLKTRTLTFDDESLTQIYKQGFHFRSRIFDLDLKNRYVSSLGYRKTDI